MMEMIASAERKKMIEIGVRGDPKALPPSRKVKDLCMFDMLCNSKEFLSDCIFRTLNLTLVPKVAYKRCYLRGPYLFDN